MKNVITTFANARQGFLNEPACPNVIAKFKERFNNSQEIKELLEMYKVFDGEKDEGALLPDWSIYSLKDTIEMINAMDKVWDDWESLQKEDGYQGCVHPMRFFIPFIATGFKTGIGPLIKSNTKYDGCVIEYQYDSGTFIVWSKTLSTFIDALFSFSIEKMPVMLSPDDENYPFSLPNEDSYYSYDFTEQDIAFLSKWSEFVFPEMKGTEIYDLDILNP